MAQAWYLQHDGSNDRVTINIAATSSESWELEWQLFNIPTGDQFGFARILGDTTAASSNNRISTEIGGGGISTRFANVTKSWASLSFVSTDLFKITYNGSQLELFINGSSKGAIAGTVTTAFGLTGCNSNFHTNIALKLLKFTNFTTPSKSRNYDPTASGGTGTLLPDTINGQNGTLNNFTGTYWIEYDDGQGGTNYTLTADGGTFAYSGGANAFSVARRISAQGFSFNYSGGQASPLVSRLLSANAGEFTYGGASVDLLTARVLSADGGQFAYSGADTSLIISRILSAQGGTFSYNGGIATISVDTGSTVYTFTATGGAFSYSGGQSGLIRCLIVNANGGAFTYTGAGAELLKGYSLPADGAEFSIIGGDVDILSARLFSADAASFTFAGGSATINYSGYIEVLIDGYAITYADDDIIINYAADDFAISYAQDKIQVTYEV